MTAEQDLLAPAPSLKTSAYAGTPVVLDQAYQLPGSTLKDLIGDNRFLVVPETMVDGLIVIDEAGIIHYVNPACTRLFKYANEQLIGQNVKMLMPSPFREHHDGYLVRHRETGVKRIIGVGRELLGLKSDGTIFPMYLSVGQARTADHGIFVGIIYDLTEKKRAEETILHHQKLDAIGQLSGGIAHDFNNILNVISGNLEMIAAGDLSPGGRRAVARAQEAATRAARITQRLLAFARKQPLNKQEIDVNKTLADMAEMLQRTIGEAVTVEMHVEPAIGYISTDIDQFETAILNLAVNARDAMPSGGRLVIEAERQTIEGQARDKEEETPPGDYICISISDTGIGMTPEVSSRAMEPFFTTKDVGSGTGLGLSMVYGFMKQIGGHARLYSEVGQGTRVTLLFPRLAVNAVAGRQAQDVSVPISAGETILVVEDDPDVRQITVSRLESLGYRVKIATDGQGALDIVKTSGNIDLALIDVVMPGGMDGHAVADEVARIAPEIKLILTSGYSPRMAAGDARQTRAFLPKPSTRAQVARIIRSVLDA